MHFLIHPTKKITCQYCDHLVADKNELLDHVYDNHAEVVLIHSMAKQLNYVSENFEKFGNLFSQIFETLNVMQQELFVIRNEQ